MRDRSNYNEYLRVYMARRYEQRKQEAVARLGGKCVKCGSAENLQFDHVLPGTKTFTIAKRLAGVSREKFEMELKKCQLLCETCHIEKTVKERGFKMARGTHGTLSAYRYCRCEKCKAAKRNYGKRRKAMKKKQESLPVEGT